MHTPQRSSSPSKFRSKVDGEFTTVQDVAEATLFFSEFQQQCPYRSVNGRKSWLVYGIGHNDIRSPTCLAQPPPRIPLSSNTPSKSARPFECIARPAIGRVRTIGGNIGSVDQLAAAVGEKRADA